MTVDKFRRSPKTRQNVTYVSGVSYEYMNSNFLRKGQAIDMSGQSIVNLGKSRGSKDAVRRKYVYERFFKKGDPINMNKKAIKTYCFQPKKATRRRKATSTRKVLAKVIWI